MGPFISMIMVVSSRMIQFILLNFEACLKRVGLYRAMRSVQFGLPHSSPHFFCILETYNTKINTFFTPVGELRFALHDIHEILALSIDETPYEEYILGAKELLRLKAIPPPILCLLGVMCHYHICVKLSKMRG